MATQVDPALQLDDQHEYILTLEGDNYLYDDKNFRAQHPQSLQLLTYADQQGCFVNKNNSYYDVSAKSLSTEAAFFETVSRLTGETAKKPSGEIYHARVPATIASRPGGVNAIDGFSPATTRGGTIVPGDFITITGSGFGAAAGTVFFTNADDGGVTFTASGVGSDIISWSDVSITVKVAQNGGTGPINVNGAFTSGSSLTVNYGHSAINSAFSGFGVSTRQRYYHRNMNGLGGYTYLYNTTSGFSANAPAVAAFERALATWRCGTFINWRSGGTTAVGFAADGINVVMFDGTLPAGVLGRATSRFTGSSIGGCTTTNTVWCANELDIQFFTDPPVAGFPWEYGPALPSGSEYDFETVALHELGHHHGLQHVIDAGAIMHFAIANGASNRVLSGNDVAGGNARMAYSTVATCFDPGACGTGPMTALTAGNCSTLPVRLISFSGEKTGPATNKLNWVTAFEQNNSGYSIERSSDGISFTEIGFIPGAGNSNQSLSYLFTDNKAGPYAWYYRLRMIDADRRESFSSTILIKGDESAEWKLWAGDNGDHIYLYSKSGTGNNALLKIFSSNGQQVMTRSIKPGNSIITVSNLSHGLYYYQLRYDEKIIRGKLMLGSK